VTDLTLTRRGVLRAAAGVAAAATVGGCTGSRPPVQVAVVWSDNELALFREVLRGYPHPVEVVSARNDINAFLSARYGTANQPDVAIFPQIGLIADYARQGRLAPMRPELAERFDPSWNNLLTVDGALYGAWVKAAHKSLFWYSPTMLGDRAVPATWEQFVALVGRLAATGGPAPLAIGAADGWVLTDWLENVLAATASEAEYQGLVTGDVDWRAAPVRTALGMLADVWAVPHAFPDGGARALLTQQEESVLQVAAEHRAAMVFEGDFVAGVADRFRPRGAPPLRTFPFPTIGTVRPLLVAGDAAVVLSGSTTGADLVDWLTRAGSFGPWIRAGGYLSPNLLVPLDAYGGGQRSQLAEKLRTPTDLLRFDLSDQLRGSLGGPDGQGIWKILQDYFAEVSTGHADVAAAIDRACHSLVRAAAQARREAGS
jgi:ABC-type glycerol-3-phosphate transport system substrate-binding protein